MTDLYRMTFKGKEFFVDQPQIGTIQFYQTGCMAVDPSRITAVHVEGKMEPALDLEEAIITCFVTWRWYDVYWQRNRLNDRVWKWIDENRSVAHRIELRFVENFESDARWL